MQFLVQSRLHAVLVTCLQERSKREGDSKSWDPGITEEQKTKEGPGGRTIRRSKRRRLRDLNLTEEQKVGAAKAAKAHTTAHTHHGRLYQQRNSA